MLPTLCLSIFRSVRSTVRIGNGIKTDSARTRARCLDFCEVLAGQIWGIDLLGKGLKALRAAARAERRALPVCVSCRPEGPGPVFGFFAEAAADWVHFDVVGFFLELVFVAEAVVEEVSLPINSKLSGGVMFPAVDGGRQAGITRDSDNRVKVVGHEQGKAAVPGLALVVECDGGENGVGDFWNAEGVFSAGGAVDGDEVERAFADPRGTVVGHAFAGWEVHGR